MLEILSDPEKWLAFFRQKNEGGHLYKTEEDDLRRFIENGEYRAVAGDLQAGAPLPYPRAAIICKHHTGKKRTVFLFPPAFFFPPGNGRASGHPQPASGAGTRRHVRLQSGHP